MFYCESIKLLQKTDSLEISIFTGLIELNNALSRCTSEQTDYDISKTINIFFSNPLIRIKFIIRKNKQREWSLPTKLEKIESEHDNIINVYFILPSTFAI